MSEVPLHLVAGRGSSLGEPAGLGSLCPTLGSLGNDSGGPPTEEQSAAHGGWPNAWPRKESFRGFKCPPSWGGWRQSMTGLLQHFVPSMDLELRDDGAWIKPYSSTAHVVFQRSFT